jgi:hypothetical protein
VTAPLRSPTGCTHHRRGHDANEDQRDHHHAESRPCL